MAILPGLWLAIILSGCAGHAEVDIVPLDTRRISTKGPLIVRASPDECYFWVNDQEELCVAMRNRSASFFGKRFEKEFLMSLVAKGVPAGGARDYRIDRRTARGMQNGGYRHTRSASMSGILTVWDHDESRLRGRFRFTAREQSYSALSGWSGNVQVLYTGEFLAKADRARGEKLLARTEEGAMARTSGVISREGPPSALTIERKSCQAPDGVTIVYSAAGAGETSLLFVHGGLADRTFFDGQLAAFADRHRVIALDLAGHGESGANRTQWGIPEFGADVKAVANAEKLKRIILFGNSLGGPTAIEAALLMPDRVIGVVGIDTFQRLDYSMTPEEAGRRAEAFRSDFSGSLKSMVTMLFHPDVDPALVAEAERRMQKTPPAVANAMFLSLAGYDQAASARKLAVPLRAINGDLFPTDVESVRGIKADFNAAVMKHVGHYPMLERPDDFNRHVADVIQELRRATPAP